MQGREQLDPGRLLARARDWRATPQGPRVRRWLAALVAAALVAVSCQPPGTPGAGAGQPPLASQQTAAPVPAEPSEVRRLVEAARVAGETELSLVWSQEALGGHEGVKRFEALFNQMYGTSVTFNFTPGPAMPEIATRLGQELASGRKASTDVFLGTETHFGAMVNGGILEEYDYTALSPRISPRVVAVRNIGAEVASIVPGITYNTTLVLPGDVPRRLEDVLNPRWKGMIASTQTAAIFPRVAARPEWGAERMTDFVRRLSPTVGGLVRCGDIQRIMGGEFSMLVLDCGSFFVRQAQAQGAPLGHVIPEDSGLMGFLHLGVPRHSARPNLGKLFVNTVLSEEGQKIVYETYFTDHPDLPGSQSAAELSELKAKAIDVLRVDARFVAERPDTGPLAEELVKILRENPGR